jgi:hypothetical protein
MAGELAIPHPSSFHLHPSSSDAQYESELTTSPPALVEI